MHKFIVVSKIPARQGLINGIPEKITIEEAEGENQEEVAKQCHVPQGGYCFVVHEDNITWIKHKSVKELSRPHQL